MSEERKKLLVVSHSAVIPVNQEVYAELLLRGWDLKIYVPAFWRHEYGKRRFRAEPMEMLRNRYEPIPVLLQGRPQRHLYKTRLRQRLERWLPEIAFIEQEPYALAAWQWASCLKRYRVPFGVQFDENLDRQLPMPAKWIRQRMLASASFVAARSPTAARLATSQGAHGRVALVAHHVPNWEVKRKTQGDRFTVGFVGRLVPEKGLDVLVQAVRLMKEPIRLLIVGDGPLRPWLESVVLSPSRLELWPPADHANISQAYAQMDVLVLPSRTTKKWSEQFGRVLVESLSCSVPVVGSTSGEIPWVIKATGGGLIFPEGDSVQLAKILERLESDPRLRQDFALKGSRKAAEMFSVSAVADSFEKVLMESLQREGTAKIQSS